MCVLLTEKHERVQGTYAKLHKWSNFNCMYGTRKPQNIAHITQLKQNASDKAENNEKNENVT